MLRPIALLMFLTLAAAPAAAEDVADFNRMVAETSAHQRDAMRLLMDGNGKAARPQIAALIEGWTAIAEHYGDSPPGPYAANADYPRVVAEIRVLADEALAAVDTDELARARGSLWPIPSMLSYLRRGSGVRVFADCVNEVNARVDRVAELSGPPDIDFAEARDIALAIKALSVYRDALERCEQEARHALGEDPAFREMADRAAAALDAADAAIAASDQAALKQAIEEILVFDRELFFRYG